ncbi:mechanosensitive ion channel [Cupriavidus basilensis]|uniref:Mechanosensitive ion channel n=1 Tax=Cupriavidus basilensis TaxID=68895 RepID=A0ABT6AGQ9_9BURK|nr:mechanosensitive ion channel domain-containing protein [Cupriavidus basilensis]MDF3831598.1 mechanosensitive ion channel [Cupriavidus basilensis]
MDVFVGSLLTLLIVLASIRLSKAAAGRLRQSPFWNTAVAYLAFPVCVTIGLLLVQWPLKSDSYLLHVYIEVAVVLLLSHAMAWAIALVFRPTVLLDRALRFVALVTGIVVAVQSLKPPKELLQLVSELELKVGASRISAEGLFNGASFGVIFFIIAISVSKAVERKLLQSRALPHNLLLALANISRVAIWSVSVVLTLVAIGIDATTMAAFGGALGIGLGLGMKRLASSYISGLIILFEQSIRIGDTISTGSLKGNVTHLTARYTMIRSSDGVEAIIPNDVLTSTTIVNESWSDRNIRLETSVLIKSDSDLSSARSSMLNAITDQPRALSEPAPSVYVAGIERLGIRLEAHFWIADPDNGKLNVISDVNASIIQRFREKGIHFPGSLDLLCTGLMPDPDR